ncbi:MAG TPA: hypothetical protein P5204_08090 [Kiritimatiellia bacterium]|nr:hypothetical protein [Kiritimatiellia bacterium]
MKYMLDIVLVLALAWLGWAWNGEKQNGLALSDEIDQLKATAARLELDLGKATNELNSVKSDLAGARSEIENLGKDLQDKVDALGAKSAESDELRKSLAAAVARVKELEGYKAKAIVAEMPKPPAP